MYDWLEEKYKELRSLNALDKTKYGSMTLRQIKEIAEAVAKVVNKIS